MQEITVAELKARTDIPLIDVRETFEYEDGHAPGAVNVPMFEIGARLDELPAEFDVICKSGDARRRWRSRSSRAGTT